MSQSSRWKLQGGRNRRPTNNIITNNNSHSNILNARTLGTVNTTIEKVADLRDIQKASIYNFNQNETNFNNVICYYPFNDLLYNTLPGETTNTYISNQSLANNLPTPQPFPLVFKDPSISGTFSPPYVAYNDSISQNVVQLNPSSQVLATDLSFNTKNAYDTSGSTISAALTMSCFVNIPNSDVVQGNQFCLFAMDDLSQNALQKFTSSPVVDGSDNLLYLWYPNKNGKAQLLYGYKGDISGGSWSYSNKQSLEQIPTNKWTQVSLVLAGLYIYVIVDGKAVITSSGSELQGASYVPDQPFNINLGPYYYDYDTILTDNLSTTNTATPQLSDCKVSNTAIGPQLAAALASEEEYGHQYSVNEEPNKSGLLYYLLSKNLVSFSTPTLFRSSLNLGGDLQSYGTNNFYGQSNFYTKTYFANGIIADGSSTIVYESEVGNLNIYSSTLGTTQKNASLFITNSSETGTNPFMASMLVFNDNIDIGAVPKNDLPSYVSDLQFSISGENVSVGHGFGDSSFNVFGNSVMDGKLDVSGNISLTGDSYISIPFGKDISGGWGTGWGTWRIGEDVSSNIYNPHLLMYLGTDPVNHENNDWAIFTSEQSTTSGATDRGNLTLTIGDNSDFQNDKFIIRGMDMSYDTNTDLAYFSTANGVSLIGQVGIGKINDSTTSALDVSGNVTLGSIDFSNGYIGISQDISSGPIRIGNAAGQTDQSNNSVAIGNAAGKTTQDEWATALGPNAGEISQQQAAVAVGVNAGNDTQGLNATAVGAGAGQISQGIGAVAVGWTAGYTDQGTGAVAIGSAAGHTDQSSNTVAIGNNAGNTSQGASSVAIGLDAGKETQGNNSVAIGQGSGQITQGDYSVALGQGAGYSKQGDFSIALGFGAGNSDQSGNSIAIGLQAGNSDQSGNSIAIGTYSGVTSQGENSVAIGFYAGQATQGYSSVAIGQGSGQITQGDYSIASGFGAGYSNQGDYSIASGFGAGNSDQSGNSIAIGTQAGNTNQAIGSVAMGYYAGNSSQGANTVAFGNQAGQTTQGTGSIALGINAGQITQGINSVAIGVYAGQTTQGANTVAFGNQAGQTTQGTGSIALGINAGQITQGINSVAIGVYAGQTTQGANTVALGNQAGQTTQGNSGVAIGVYAGHNNQAIGSVAMGYYAGASGQLEYSVAIGNQAGQIIQGQYSVALGINAGNSSQGINSVAIGNAAGQITQGTGSVALGNAAGYSTQGDYSVAFGINAGNSSQGINSVAIGNAAGQTSQGTYSVAIGPTTVCQHNVSVALGSGATTTANNQIVLGTATETVKIPGQLDVSGTGNFTGTVTLSMSSTTTASNTLTYNTTTKEIQYAPITSGSITYASANFPNHAITNGFGVTTNVSGSLVLPSAGTWAISGSYKLGSGGSGSNSLSGSSFLFSNGAFQYYSNSNQFFLQQGIGNTSFSVTHNINYIVTIPSSVTLIGEITTGGFSMVSGLNGSGEFYAIKLA